jgi:hypothetical protein
MSAEIQVRARPFTLPLAIQTPAGYFRSKLFSSNAASNPLVAAASPILSLLERLCISQTLRAIETMRENLEHELFAFQDDKILETNKTRVLGSINLMILELNGIQEKLK